VIAGVKRAAGFAVRAASGACGLIDGEAGDKGTADSGASIIGRGHGN